MTMGRQKEVGIGHFVYLGIGFGSFVSFGIGIDVGSFVSFGFGIDVGSFIGFGFGFGYFVRLGVGWFVILGTRAGRQEEAREVVEDQQPHVPKGTW